MNKRQMAALSIVVFVVASSKVLAAAPVVADSSGRVLGFYSGGLALDNGATVVVITPKGFTVRLDVASGSVTGEVVDPWGTVGVTFGNLYYESSDCSGDAFVPGNAPFRGGVMGIHSGQLFYIEKNVSPATFVNGSRSSSGVCQSGSFTGGPFYLVRPNDPTVTGFSDDPVEGPLSIEVATIEGSSFDLFRDGFEGAMLVHGGGNPVAYTSLA